jgi:hypothetical protein
MNLVASFQNFATRVGQEFKSVRTLLNNNAPDLTALSTTAKTSILAAINELAQANTDLRGLLTSGLQGKADTAFVTESLAAQNAQVATEINTALSTQLGDPNVDLVAVFNAALV